MPALTRGPLPPSVYWRRRLILLTAALVILWGVVHLLSGGGDSTPKAGSAADLTSAKQTAGSTPSADPSADPSAVPSAGASMGPSTGAAVPLPSTTPTPAAPTTPTVLPTPTGPCPPSDVSVSPSVTGAAAGSDVPIVLNLQTFSTPACTWEVSHKTMQVKVSKASGTDVWSTVQCPAALVPSEVTIYKDTVTPVTVTWSGRQSDATCSKHTAWSWPGKFSVTAVALGGVPDQESFTLGPAAPTGAPTTSATQPSTSASATPTGGAATTTTSPNPSTSATTTPPKPKKHKKQQNAD